MPVAFDFSHQGQALVTLYDQFLCSDWSRFDCILKLVYFDSWSWQRFVSTCDVFNCLFPLDVRNELQLLSIVFCYSWLVCLLVFWLRDASLVKVGNPISDGFVFVFHLAWKLWSDTGLTWYLSGAASRLVSLSKYCIWCLFFYILFNEVKRSLCGYLVMHVCKIWDNDLTEHHVWYKLTEL